MLGSSPIVGRFEAGISLEPAPARNSLVHRHWGELPAALTLPAQEVITETEALALDQTAQSDESRRNSFGA